MNKAIFQHVKKGDRPSAKEYNKLVDVAATVINSQHVDGFLDSTGFHTRRSPGTALVETSKIMEVQSEAVGDGLYTCREEKLLNAEWADEDGDDKFSEKSADEYTVLNLMENDPEPGYVAHLVAGDLIKVWQIKDDEENSRWVGIPLIHSSGQVRQVWVKTTPGAVSTVVCYLDVNTTGTEITVTCHICGGAELNSAIPRLTAGDEIFVTKIGTTWYCTTVFQAIDETKGLEISSGKLAAKLDTDEMQFESGGISTKLDECV